MQQKASVEQSFLAKAGARGVFEGKEEGGRQKAEGGGRQEEEGGRREEGRRRRKDLVSSGDVVERFQANAERLSCTIQKTQLHRLCARVDNFCLDAP